ncbi:MrcB family domain-containing protein [Asticcacaulis solisilvae]|uniref:MrcB family domain-containing protein n=1 Tax=Asticcacaulis solisilvae TaxID=1217274 RepID=UPI003FD89C25
MRETLAEIVRLQLEFSPQNTPAMERRGILVRRTLPLQLRALGQKLRDPLGIYGADADAEGRDGTGTKTYIPWTRWYNKVKAPSAQDGWYIVYLFHADGSGVSLCLIHGSTDDGVPKPEKEIQYLMDWAGKVVGQEFRNDSQIRRGISLGSVGYGSAYERTTLFSKFYPAGAIPGDSTLEADLVRFLGPLQKLYYALDHGLQPGTASPDLRDLEAEIDKVVSPLKPPAKGQGRGLPGPLRKAVELHAMGMAREWLDDHKFKYEDVSAKESCDFRATRDGQEWVVEVKGTTGGSESILITRSEVALHLSRHPQNILIVVSGIELDESNGRTSGGTIQVHNPWHLDESRLAPICFEYRL